MNNNQLERIKEMEAALDASDSAIRNLSDALDRYEDVISEYNKLEEYYSSGEWRIDFEADEAGLIPADVKRGVLSEDAVYDLITGHEELINRMRTICCKPDRDVFIADGVVIDGDNISIGKDSSVWFNSVIRCDDAESITIGERTNIQDLTMIHTGPGYPVSIGDEVTVGHMCMIHGCTIGSNTLIGMGSVIMDGARIGNNCVIGAGSLVTEGKTIPDGTMAFGRPAKVIRELTADEIRGIGLSADHYVAEMRKHR